MKKKSYEAQNIQFHTNIFMENKIKILVKILQSLLGIKCEAGEAFVTVIV